MAIARRLADDGAHVVVSGRNAERGTALVTAIRASGAEASFVAADLAGGDGAIRALAEQATEAVGGRLDILVNNAATLLMPTPTGEVSPSVLREAFEVNVFAPFLLTGGDRPRDGAWWWRRRGEHRIDHRTARGERLGDLQLQQGGHPLAHGVLG